MIKGLNRGLVDGNYTNDDVEAWVRWADGIMESAPEMTLCQLFLLAEYGSFDNA